MNTSNFTSENQKHFFKKFKQVKRFVKSLRSMDLPDQPNESNDDPQVWQNYAMALQGKLGEIEDRSAELFEVKTVQGGKH